MIDPNILIATGSIIAGLGTLPELKEVYENPVKAISLDSNMLLIRAAAFVVMAVGLGIKRPLEIRIFLLVSWMTIYSALLYYYKYKAESDFKKQDKSKTN